jgi:hypothetical protein
MIDIDAVAMEARLRDLRGNSARPVDVTIDVDDSQRRFSLLLKKGSGPESSLHIDLDEAGVRSLLDSRHGLADFATYVVAGARRYAIVLEAPEPSQCLTHVTSQELDAGLAEQDVTLLRLRSYIENGQRLLPPSRKNSVSARWCMPTSTR